MKGGEGAAKEHVCMTQGHGQHCGDRQGKGVALGGGGRRASTHVPVSRWAGKDSVSTYNGVLSSDKGKEPGQAWRTASQRADLRLSW